LRLGELETAISDTAPIVLSGWSTPIIRDGLRPFGDALTQLHELLAMRLGEAGAFDVRFSVRVDQRAQLTLHISNWRAEFVVDLSRQNKLVVSQESPHRKQGGTSGCGSDRAAVQRRRRASAAALGDLAEGKG
jgi:hypothetical protein